MNSREFATIVAALKTYYPRENFIPTKPAMELWFRQLSDIPKETMEAAVNKWVATNKWPPSIAELRETSMEIQMGETKTWSEGWASVMDAVRRFGSWDEGKAMESFDSITRMAVKRLGFKNICNSENIAADRANFRMIYEQIREQDKANSQLPLPVLKQIEALRKGLGGNERKEISSADQEN